MNKIMANTTLYARSIGDHNCIFEIKVLRRTAKRATIKDYHDKIRDTKIYTDDNGNEYLEPEKYSFAPRFHAGDTKRPLRDWEK